MVIAAAVAALVAAAAPAAQVEVGCAARSEPPAPPGAPWGIAAELPGGGRFGILNTRGITPSRVRLGGREVWMWKTPAALTADRSVVLAVSPRQARRARLGWKHPRSFARAPRTARFTACPHDEPRFSGPGVVGPRTGWGGSLVTLRRRVCLRLRVHDGASTVPLRVPLGRRCA